MTKIELRAFHNTNTTVTLTGESILGREPLEVARAVLLSAKRHGPSSLYVDGQGRMAIRQERVVYSDELPALWLVGTYTADASTVRVMEDLQLRLSEVRAARG